MIQRLTAKSGRPIDKDTATRIAKTILKGMGAYVGAVKVFNWAINYIPGGTIASPSTNTLINCYFTYRLGKYTAVQLVKTDADKADITEALYGATKFVMQFSMDDLHELWSFLGEILDHGSEVTEL